MSEYTQVLPENNFFDSGFVLARVIWFGCFGAQSSNKLFLAVTWLIICCVKVEPCYLMQLRHSRSFEIIEPKSRIFFCFNQFFFRWKQKKFTLFTVSIDQFETSIINS